MGIRLKKRLFPFIREIIIITIVTTSTNLLKTLGKKRDRRWNETTAKGEKKEERRRLGNRKQRKEKEEEKKRGEEKRSGSPAKRRYGCNIKYQQYCLVASVLWHLKNKTRTPVSAASPPPLPPPSPLHARCRKPAGIQNGWLGLHRAWATVVPSTRAPPSSWNVSISPRWYLASFARPENSPLLVKNFLILLSIHLFIYLVFPFSKEGGGGGKFEFFFFKFSKSLRREFVKLKILSS